MLHLDISGNDTNDEHLLNIPFIYVILLAFHLDKSGNDDSDEQLLKA